MEKNTDQGYNPVEGGLYTEDEAEDDFEQVRCGCDKQYNKTQENKSRGNWSSGHSTISLISMVISLSIISRFPYLLYSNGPGFLVLYTLFLFGFGLPMVYLAMTMGQFSSSGVLTCWPLPFFKGVGATMLAYGVPTLLMYNAASSWALYYLHQTVQASAQGIDLPWHSYSTFGADCNQSLIELQRYAVLIDTTCKEHSEHEYYSNELIPEHGVCWEAQTNYLGYSIGNRSETIAAVHDLDKAKAEFLQNPNGPLSQVLKMNRPSELFFKCNIQNFPEGEKSPNMLVPVVTVSSLVVYLLLILSASLGYRSIGVVTMISVPVSLLLLLLFVFRAVTLPGALHGIMYGFSHFVYNPYILLSAFQEAFLAGTGIIITYSSYNRFHHSHVRDSVLVVVFAWIVNVLSAVFVLGVLGFASFQKNVSFDQVMFSGFVEPFGIFTEAFQMLPVSKVWNGLVFLLLLILPFHYQLGMLETIVTALIDQIPRLRRFRPLVVVIAGVLLFLLGLPLCTPSFRTWFTLIDFNIINVPVLMSVVLMLVCYIVYGAMTYFWYRHDVAAMTRYDCFCSRSIVTWMFVTFSLMMTLYITCISLINQRIHTYFATDDVIEQQNPKPTFVSNGLKICMAIFPFAVLLLTLIIQIILAAIWKKPSLKDLFTKVWRPALRKHQILVDRFRAQNKYSTQRYDREDASRQNVRMAPIVDDSTPPPPYMDEAVNLTSYSTKNV